MARPTERGKTTRVAVASSDQRSRLTPTTQLTTASSAGSAAAQLARALGVGAALAEQVGERNFAEGVKDFEVGTIDAKRMERQRKYASAVTRLRARSRWVSDKDEFEQTLRTLDLDNITREELHQHLDAMFREKYDGLDDEDVAAVILPRLQEFRAEVDARYVARQREIVDTQNLADLMNVAQDMYDTALADLRAVDPFASGSSVFDYAELHRTIRADLQYNGAETNALLFNILSNLAIRNGDPDLLRNIPEYWVDPETGQRVPTFKNIPSYQEKLLNAETRAQAVLDGMISEARKEEERARKQALDEAHLRAALAILSNDDPVGAIAEYAALPGAEGSTLLALQSAYRAHRDDVEQRLPNPQFVARLTQSLYSGEANLEDIMTAFGLGLLGSGNAAVNQAQELMNIWQEVTRAGDLAARDPMVRYDLDNIEDRYRPDIDGAFGALDPARMAIQIEAKREYITRVMAGEDREAVFREVTEKYDAALDRRGRSVSRTVMEEGLGVSPAAVKAFVRGEIPIQHLIAQGVAANPDVLDDMVAEGQITPDEAIAVINALVDQLTQ